MAAPTVQALNDIIAQYTAAQAPENAQIDTSINNNDQSGAGQVAGLNAAKDNAFGGITQNAVDRGGYFSGFTPDQEAKYTGATYLPALAKVQSTIANTRNTLLGQKASLLTQANTAALSTQQDQQKALDSYNQQQEAAAAAAAAAERDYEFKAQQNALDRSASAAKSSATAAAKVPTVADATALVNSLRGEKIGDSGYGSIAQYLQNNGYDISRGSVFDRGLRSAFGFNSTT